MNLRDRLNNLDSRQRVLKLLHNRYTGSEIVAMKPELRYLQLLLHEDQGGQAKAWLDVDAWLETMDVHLPNIPWREVPLNYLARWLQPLELSFLLEDRVWQVAQITARAEPHAGLALSLPAEPCPLLCLDWPRDEMGQGAMQISPVRQVTFQLQIVLGYSLAGVAELTDVAPGDLLMIARFDPHLAVGERRLYRLSYYPHQEVIVEDLSTEREEILLEEEHLQEWASLPVEIAFVLDGRPATLAELEAVGPGTALALQPEAEQNVKIYLNKKLFGRGELVALENGSLAVEINHVNPGLAGNAERSDAE